MKKGSITTVLNTELKKTVLTVSWVTILIKNTSRYSTLYFEFQYTNFWSIFYLSKDASFQKYLESNTFWPTRPHSFLHLYQDTLLVRYLVHLIHFSKYLTQVCTVFPLPTTQFEDYTLSTQSLFYYNICQSISLPYCQFSRVTGTGKENFPL